ncbi:NDP-hexose 2,3-dehydratase family protein [Patescibacteria group bacterium]|nr:NDP-hexose 2,3-dehydratase family protein [Patescibacteria group bacterium]
MLTSYTRFTDFETGFLQPLAAHRKIQTTPRPLSELKGWEFTEAGTFSSKHFTIEGRHVEFEPEENNTEPKSWDQPLYSQESGTLVLAIDEDGFILVKGLFEPGNARRGYKQQGLVLCTTLKYSAANLERQRVQGHTPPFAELLTHEAAEHLFTIPAPGDGARADKQNIHSLVRVNRTLLTARHEALKPLDQSFFALIHKDVLLECYSHGISSEHLRDISSLLLFIR